jgi:hypothetical protein
MYENGNAFMAPSFPVSTPAISISRPRPRTELYTDSPREHSEPTAIRRRMAAVLIGMVVVALSVSATSCSNRRRGEIYHRCRVNSRKDPMRVRNPTWQIIQISTASIAGSSSKLFSPSSMRRHRGEVKKKMGISGQPHEGTISEHYIQSIFITIRILPEILACRRKRKFQRGVLELWHPHRSGVTFLDHVSVILVVFNISLPLTS